MAEDLHSTLKVMVTLTFVILECKDEGVLQAQGTISFSDTLLVATPLQRDLQRDCVYPKIVCLALCNAHFKVVIDHNCPDPLNILPPPISRGSG